MNATDYRCEVVVYSPALMILRSTLVTVSNGYCAPFIISCTALDTLNSFIIPGELGTQINDVGTGCSTNAYDNRTGQSVTLAVSKVYTVQVSSQYSPSEQVAIWIDFNHNFVFEMAERVALQALNSTLNTPVTMTIPTLGAGATLGVHRMRATVAYSVAPNPCSSGTTFGETHDYSVNIISNTSKPFFLRGK
jgi:hypothetical protein